MQTQTSDPFVEGIRRAYGLQPDRSAVKVKVTDPGGVFAGNKHHAAGSLITVGLQAALLLFKHRRAEATEGTTPSPDEITAAAAGISVDELRERRREEAERAAANVVPTIRLRVRPGHELLVGQRIYTEGEVCDYPAIPERLDKVFRGEHAEYESGATPTRQDILDKEGRAVEADFPLEAGSRDASTRRIVREEISRARAASDASVPIHPRKSK